MKMMGVVIVMACALSGCVTWEEQQAQMADAKCQSWGAKPGTHDYIACRSQADQTLAYNQRTAYGYWYGVGRSLR